MHVLDANELFAITSYTYDRIMEEGGKNGPDAFALYFRLLKQARIQETNQTWSLNEFLQKSMGRGRERLQNAKKVLNDLGLIDYIKLRDGEGRFGTQYIRVNYLIDEEKARTNHIAYELQVDRLTAKPSDDKTTTNTIVLNKNAGSTKENKGKKKGTGIPTVLQLVEAYKNTPELVSKINDEDVVREFAEYKQSTHKTAYKTIEGFIQKLVAYVNLVSFGEIRYDVGDRLRYALNETRDNGWIRLVRNDEMERGYQTVKKFKRLTQKQNE